MTSAFGYIAYTLLVFVAILPKQVLTVSQIPPTPQNVLFLKTKHTSKSLYFGVRLGVFFIFTMNSVRYPGSL